jgi:hypothetical protein
MGSLRNLRSKVNELYVYVRDFADSKPESAKPTATPPLFSDQPVWGWSFSVTLDALPGAEAYISSTGPLAMSSDVVLVDDKGSDIAVAGRSLRSRLPIEFKEYEQFDVFGKLLQWRQRIIANSDLNNPSLSNPSAYKCDGKLTICSSSGNPVGSPITMVGCWPSSIELPELNYSSVDMITIKVVLEIDSFA